MEPTIEQLRQNYKRYPDHELIRLASQDVYGLRPEAVQVMKEEVERRGLSPGIIDGIEIQLRDVSEEELMLYCELIRHVPCPKCGSSSSKLNAVITKKVMSFILISNLEKQMHIACPACLNNAAKDAMIATALLGWWSFPHGVFRTIPALVFNYNVIRRNKKQEPTELLIKFVSEQLGTIEANKNDTERLITLVKYLA